MSRLTVFVSLLLTFLPLHAQWSSVNIDRQTVAAMTAAYGLQAETERSIQSDVEKILDHYRSSEVATAGIFASKWFDRRAMTDAGLFSSQENYYYTHIYNIVSQQIMPKLLSLSFRFVKQPEKALYWGPWLLRITRQVEELCMTFECVVTNGKLSFSDIHFLAINDNLIPLFDLARYGDVDWKALWDNLSDVGDLITKEELLEDLTGLLDAGSAIANAGGSILDSTLVSGSKIGDLFHMKPREIVNLYQQFADMYDTFSDPLRVRDLVMSQIRSTDSTGVSNLFTVSGYNISSHVTDYLQRLEHRYYTQQWYIYRSDSGRELVCDYSPPSSVSNLRFSDEWYRVETDDPSYRPSTSDYNASLQNSEGHAGWSHEQCNSLNHQNTGFTYDFENTLHVESCNVQGKHYACLAHDIIVWKTWNSETLVYEELFDSQFNDERVMSSAFSARLSELNANEEGIVYQIGKGEKVYYQAADEARMGGCSTVCFTRECSDFSVLGEGNLSWKENGDQSNGLDDNSRRFAMETTVGEPSGTAAFDEEIDRLSSVIVDCQSELNTLQQEQNNLMAQIRQLGVDASGDLIARYNRISDDITYVRAQKREAENRLGEVRRYREHLLEDYYDEVDGSYRIPAVMREIEDAYGVSWSDAGTWSGWTFVRHGSIAGIQGEVTFKADLSMQRSESHFLGIRYHRAILSVHWQLSAAYSSSEIIDFVHLDPSMSDAEKASFVNLRQRQLMEDSPGCTIEANYAYSTPPSTEDDEDSFHLLWVSDRLAVARDVNHRLELIYADLVLLEKYMYNSETLKIFLLRNLDGLVLGHVRSSRIGNRTFRRWKAASHAASFGGVASDYLDDDE